MIATLHIGLAKMKLPHVKSDIQIRFSDLDMQGHVSNSVYMQYFDIGRMDFFYELSKESEVTNNVVASVHIDMLSEVSLKDKLVLETWCSKKGNKSITLEQHLFANDHCVTTCTIVLVGFDRETRQSIALPQEWEASERPG